MAIQGASRKIGLLDHMGGGNLGDDATQTAVIQNIAKRWPGAEIIGLSMNPLDTQKRHGIPSYAIRRNTWGSGPWPVDCNLSAQPSGNVHDKASLGAKVSSALRKRRFVVRVVRLIKLLAVRAPKGFIAEIRFLFRALSIVRSLDLLVISGGGQLLDRSGGPWKFPYTIWKWIFLAKVSDVKRIFLNVGAGPLDHRLSKFFVKQALRSAYYVSFRDEKSQTLIQQIGFKGRSEVAADCVYSLDVPGFASDGIRKVGNSTVGISPMAYCDPRVYWKKDQRSYDAFMRKLTIFASRLIASGYQIVLFTSDIWFDRQTLRELRKSIEREIPSTDACRILDEPVDSTEELFARMSLMDYIVTCRFHGVVFAHLVNKPVLAISHHPKVATLMNDIGLAEYCCDISSFDTESLWDRFTLLVRNAEKVKTGMADTLVRYRIDLWNQFDALFPCRES